jgi:hypothetical protein
MPFLLPKVKHHPTNGTALRVVFAVSRNKPP